MKITTQGNGIRIGTRLEEKIAAKMSKFDKYFGDEGSLNVRIRPEGPEMIVEITMKFDGKILRAEASDEDILTAVDRTVDKLESQIRRQKTKFLKKKKEYPEIVNYLEDDGGADFDLVDEKEEKITKRKQFALQSFSLRCSDTISSYISTAIQIPYVLFTRDMTEVMDYSNLNTDLSSN